MAIDQGLKEYLARQEVAGLLPTKPSATHPAHYRDLKPEPIDVIADWGLNFNRGNALKYIVRAGKKDPAKTVEDLRKAIVYLEHEIMRCSK